MSTYRTVAKVEDLSPGRGIAVEVDDRKIALFNVGGKYFAIGDACTHRGGPLSEGEIEGQTVICPWHGACFELATGKNLTPPAPGAVPCYGVRVEGSEIQVDLS